MIWQEMSNLFPKEDSTKSLIAHHWKDVFLCTIWNIKWFKFSHGYILNSNIFPTSTHTPKSELKRRSYGPDKLEKKNQLLSRKLVATRKWCRDQKIWPRPRNGVATKKLVSRPGDCVAIRKLGRDQKRCRNLKKAEH